MTTSYFKGVNVPLAHVHTEKNTFSCMHTVVWSELEPEQQRISKTNTPKMVL